MRLKIRYPLFIGMILWGSLALPLMAQTFQRLTLQDAITLTLQHNKKLQIKSIENKVTTIRAEDIRQDKLPEVAFNSNVQVLDNLHQYEQGLGHPSTMYETPRFKYNFTIDAEIPLYTGGKLKYEEKKAHLDIEIQDLHYRKAERDVKMQLIAAYLHGLHLQQQKKLILEKMREDSLVIAQSEKLRQNGVVTNNDVLRTKLQFSNHQMLYYDLEKDLTILEHEVKILLALPEEVEMHIDTEGLFSDIPIVSVLEDLVAQARNNSESLHIAEKEAEQKELDKKLVHANVLPKVFAGGEYGYNYPNFMFFPPVEHLYRFGAVGISLKMPLSNLYKNKTKVNMANEQLKMAQLTVEEKEEQLRHEVFAAQKKLEEATRKIGIAQQAIDQAKENYRIVRLKYSNQLSLITELIDADNACLEAQSNLLSLKINRQLKYYQLQYVLGRI